MMFGPCPLEDAEGAILAHSMALPDRRLRKGRVLQAPDIAALRAAGHTEVLAARLGPGDLTEDAAAARIAEALVPEPAALNVSRSAPFTGRANIFAERPGVVTIDTAAVERINAVDDAITLATLPDKARVSARAMLATVKIIPYAVPAAAVESALRGLNGPLLRVHPVVRRSADLILTETPGMKPSLLDKGERAVAARLEALGVSLASTRTVAHDFGPLAEAYRAGSGDMTLVLTASATSDVADVGPQALVQAGGHVARFGMPVDPGNLLFLGALEGRPVIGLPGCVRSPALNGADWVLERIACDVAVTAQ
ncbi:MAG: molybdopterin-binding protein, partial [Pseudomonadota bacterium]